MITSALSTAEDAFTALTARPAPLAFDARGIPGLPDRHVDLAELRDLLTAHAVDEATADLVWRALVVQARTWGPAWMVAVVGMAVPGLTRVAARLAVGHPGLVEDIDSEVLVGFLQAVRTEDLAAPRVWVRLLWAAWRSGERARWVREDAELPDDLPAGSSTPRMPYGHPDLVLGRAVVAGILTVHEAGLIGDTRLGEVLMEQIADACGVSAPVLRMRRLRAERRLVAALRQGTLSDVVPGASVVVDPTARAHRNGLAPRSRRRATAAGHPHGARAAGT